MIDMLPNDFVYLHAVDPTIHQEIRYATPNNFVGKVLKGYEAQECILTYASARALSNVQKELKKNFNYSLLVYDCYRPQMASNDMKAWAFDESDQRTKPDYYPNVDKKNFYELGYVGEKSGHSRGSTMDLTIIDSRSGKPLDMGTHFDFMDPRSHPSVRTDITDVQYKNRQFLKQLMEKHGFAGIETEWWHFTLKHEPFPDTYFNFIVRANLKTSVTSKKVASADS